MTSSSFLMTRALDENGEIVAVDDVLRGRACNCTCVSCGGALVARHGDVRSHSFAHDSDTVCSWSGETELHLLAKEVFLKDKLLEFNHLALGGKALKMRVDFEEVLLEDEVLGFVPDVVGVAASGDCFLIEICVTHSCSEDKIKAYRRHRVNAFEVVLSKELLIGKDTISLNFVRSAIRSAKVVCISRDPLSDFFKDVVSLNNKVLKKQGSDLRELRQCIRESESQIRGFLRKKAEIANVDITWKSMVEEVQDRIKKYETNLLEEIHANEQISRYSDLVKSYTHKLNSLPEEYNRRIGQVNAELDDYKEEQKKLIREHFFHKEIERLRSEIERLQKVRAEVGMNGAVRSVDEYKQMLDAKFENLVLELNESLGSTAVDRATGSNNALSSAYGKVRG